MEPEHDDFQKESPFPGADFQVPCSHWKLTCPQKDTVAVGRLNFPFWNGPLFRGHVHLFLFFFFLGGGGYLLSTRLIGHPQQPKNTQNWTVEVTKWDDYVEIEIFLFLQGSVGYRFQQWLFLGGNVKRGSLYVGFNEKELDFDRCLPWCTSYLCNLYRQQFINLKSQPT